MKLNEHTLTLPPDMDSECIELCNTLNSLPLTTTFESCSGHGRHPFWIWFRCTSIDVISRLGRAVDKNYSDGNWEIVVDSNDTNPTGVFWLRTRSVLSRDELLTSITGLIDSILYWCDDKFDEYFNKTL